MLGSNWPNNGEIDIIEGVNSQSTNQMTLHTGDGCSIVPLGFSGTLDTSNCYVEASGQSANAGCAIESTSNSSYGDGFNKAGGGVYATEWTGDAINVWFFPNSSVPSDITNGKPNPLGWGLPSARFAGACDIDSHFKDLQIVRPLKPIYPLKGKPTSNPNAQVFDITFCGDWAGAVWPTDTCASKASTCNAYVQNNPTAFKESYWRVNSLKVYQDTASSLLDIDVDLDAHLDAHLKAAIRPDANEPIEQPQIRRGAPYVRPPPRPVGMHRREQYRHGHKHGF